MARRSISRSTRPSHLVVGAIAGAHGVRGELRVIPDTDNPRRFRAGQRVLVEGLGERRILGVRGSGRRLVVRLEAVDDREAAAALGGRELRVPIELARQDVEGHLWADLVGLQVSDESGTELGILEEILRAGETDVFVVRDVGGRERLFPAVDSVVRAIDVEGGRVVVRPQEEA